MLQKINCQTEVNQSISSLYASALYMIMAYMPPKDVLADLNNDNTVQEEKNFDLQLQQLSAFDSILPPAELGLEATGINTACNKNYTYNDKYYTCANGVARISTAIIEDQKSLVVAFRGTENILVDGQDYPNFDWHYVLYKPLVDGLINYIQNHPEIEQIIITGHSLGGAMVEEFLNSVQKEAFINKIRGITFGSAGSRDNIGNNVVLLNIRHDHDLVPIGSAILADHLHGATLKVDKPDTPFLTYDISAHSKYEYLDTTQQILQRYDIEQILTDYKQACVDQNNTQLLEQIEKIGLLDVQGDKVLTKDALLKFIKENPPESTHLQMSNNLAQLENKSSGKQLDDLMALDPHVTVKAQVEPNPSLGNTFQNTLQKPLNPIGLKIDEHLSVSPETSVKTDSIKILANQINASQPGKFPIFKAYVSQLKKALLSKFTYGVESGVGTVDHGIATGAEDVWHVINPEKTSNPNKVNKPSV